MGVSAWMRKSGLQSSHPLGRNLLLGYKLILNWVVTEMKTLEWPALED